MECHPEPPMFSACLFKNCMLGTYFCTRCWVGERPQWSCIPNLLCHFNKLLSQSCDHTSVLWRIRCFEEERKRFNVLPWQFVPVSFSATCDKGIQAGRLSAFFAQSMSIVPKSCWFDFLILSCFIFPASPPSSASEADADGLGKATLNLKVTWGSTAREIFGTCQDWFYTPLPLKGIAR